MKKTKFIPSSELKCLMSRVLYIIIGWGESGKAIFQVSVAVFFGSSQNIFLAKNAQPS